MITDNRLELSTDENFNAEGYLAANPDVKAAGMPARLHFELHGRREGRSQFAGPPDARVTRLTVLGNCQAPVLALCLRMMLPDAEIHDVHLGVTSTETVAASDIVLLQTEFAFLADDRAVIPARQAERVRLWPTFYYSAFHPDLVYARAGDASLESPLHEYNSALVLYGWLRGLTIEQTVGLFREDVFDRLGYFDHAASADAHLADDFARAGLDGAALLGDLKRLAPFCHAVNHPTLAALARIASAVLDTTDLSASVRDVERFLADPLLSGPVWPVYPSVADRLDLTGSYDFKTPGAPGRVLDLEGFVTGAFAQYARHDRAAIQVDRLASQADRYRDLEDLARPGPRRGSNPYAKLPDHHFWRRAVAGIAPAELDPVTKPEFRLTPEDRIATAGSCFAQHIARRLIDRGFNYHVTERGPGGADLFSARFGNIYSARQLLQLARRCYGLFQPRDVAWIRPDGRYADPFRPQIEPDGFASEHAVAQALPQHLAAVRRMFEDSHLFIFTVGLTEIWESTVDGAVFPVAPGVVAQPPDPSLYRFANMTAAEVRADLAEFIALVRERNPGLKILLTVSPVPLVATYEDRHVLLSTTYSKSALRAAVDEICRDHDAVDYFPSYEIITSWHNRGTYFQDDLRSVAESGVAHVMRVFERHYMRIADRPGRRQDATLRAEFARSSKILCDEEALDAGT
jgi:GSCFA family/Polysaccharide biosynthesis enzyme WcbI